VKRTPDNFSDSDRQPAMSGCGIGATRMGRFAATFPMFEGSSAFSSGADVPLEEQIRAAGMLLVAVSDAGDLLRLPARGEDWLSDLICHSQMGRTAFLRAARRWANERAPQLAEVVPGLLFAPMPLVCRRRRTGYMVAVLPLTEFVESEHLAGMCQSARMDFELTCRLLRQLPPAVRGDAGRLVSLVHSLQCAYTRMANYQHDIEATGTELAASYEEISLLYTITQSMRVAQQPERFVQLVAEELLGTLPYAWTGVLLGKGLGVGEMSALRQSVGNMFLVCGSPPTSKEALRSLVDRLFARVRPNAPIVIEPSVTKEYELFRGLGKAALVHPVSIDDRVVGIIIAGDKLGEDTSASSVDMKLLGATANHMAIFLENATLYDDLNTMFLGSLEALTASIDAKDRYTCGHSRRVAHLTQQLARAIGLDDETVDRMHIAGMVHDVGKIGVPERVLLKPGKLTDEEFAWIRRHPDMGYRILKDIPQLSDILPGVLHHHERWDGRGYPEGLKGDEIPLVARLIGLADAFDAMSSNRTYRAAMKRASVLKEIERFAGKQFDPELVPEFLKLDFSEFDRLVDEHKAAERQILDGLPGISIQPGWEQGSDDGEHGLRPRGAAA
jgi:HD-GYP domain-containing protein (c-di-GMP phosphodiesterase class II)